MKTTVMTRGEALNFCLMVLGESLLKMVAKRLYVLIGHNCQSGVWKTSSQGQVGYYCRRTSFDKGRSDDYVGLTPRTDDNCPVIQPGDAPNGYCSCMKILLAY
jgi:hypothetical protein